MAPHLSRQELDRVFNLFAKGEATTQILERITARRAKRGVEAPMLGAIQRALKGNTFKLPTIRFLEYYRILPFCARVCDFAQGL